MDVDELIGRTFLKDEEEDGTVLRGKIIKELDQMDRANAQDPTLRKFLCTVGKDKQEEILSYNEIIGFMENDDYDRYWKYKRISDHEGPLTPTDAKWKGDRWNV